MKDVTRKPLSTAAVLFMILLVGQTLRPTLQTVMDFVHDIAPYVIWSAVLFVVIRLAIAWGRRW